MNGQGHSVTSLLRTEVSTSRDDGRLQAVVELEGELCPCTAPQLRGELEELIDGGIADITLVLEQLRFCTSHGLDLFDDVHRRLARDRGGSLELVLDGAAECVKRTVHLVQARDPSFSVVVTESPSDQEGHLTGR